MILLLINLYCHQLAPNCVNEVSACFEKYSELNSEMDRVEVLELCIGSYEDKGL